MVNTIMCLGNPAGIYQRLRLFKVRLAAYSSVGSALGRLDCVDEQRSCGGGSSARDDGDLYALQLVVIDGKDGLAHWCFGRVWRVELEVQCLHWFGLSDLVSSEGNRTRCSNACSAFRGVDNATEVQALKTERLDASTSREGGSIHKATSIDAEDSDVLSRLRLDTDSGNAWNTSCEEVEGGKLEALHRGKRCELGSGRNGSEAIKLGLVNEALRIHSTGSIQ